MSFFLYELRFWSDNPGFFWKSEILILIIDEKSKFVLCLSNDTFKKKDHICLLNPLLSAEIHHRFIVNRGSVTTQEPLNSSVNMYDGLQQDT